MQEAIDRESGSEESGAEKLGAGESAPDTNPLADTLDQVQEALPLQILIEVIGVPEIFTPPGYQRNAGDGAHDPRILVRAFRRGWECSEVTI